jgi:hypothetical protein
MKSRDGDGTAPDNRMPTNLMGIDVSDDGHEVGGNQSTLSTLADRTKWGIRTKSELATIPEKKL